MRAMTERDRPSDPSAARRARRLRMLAIAVGGAAILVVIAIVVSSGGGGKSKTASTPAASTSGSQTQSSVPGAKEASAMLAGIPQQGIALGDPHARVTMVEFADLQCPFCREYTLQTLPLLIRDYVRPGKLRLEFRNLSFLGPDSVTAGRVAGAAAKQNKLWNLADVFYFNQREENSGYVTPDYLSIIEKGVPGLDVARLRADAQAADATAPLQEANALANRFGVDSTPSFLLGPTQGTLKKLDGLDPTDVAGFRSAIDAQLRG
jgi:protein-disulfide isomerase